MPTRKLRSITAEDLYRFSIPSGMRLSPDGRHIVYAVERVERKTEKKYSNLWIAPTEGGQAKQFTFGEQGDSNPCWSPDGSQIAFLSNRKNKEKPAQVYLIPFIGGEAHPLCEMDGEINSLEWSPNGRRLLLSVRKLDAETVERQKDEQKKKLGVVSRRYERLFYKLDGYGYLPQERQHLWTVDARTGKVKQLTDHAVYDEYSPAWSPDSQWIAFCSNRSIDPDQTPDRADVFVIPAAGGEMRRIETPVGDKGSLSFSPDGKWLAYYGTEGEGQWYKNTCLWIVPVDGSTAPRNLTVAYDLHIASSTINDMGQPDVTLPTWNINGQRIYFPVTLYGGSQLQSIDLNGSQPRVEIGPGGVAGNFSFDRQQRRIAYFYGTLYDPVQFHVCELASGQKTDRQLTRLNRNLLDGIDLGQVEEAWIKGPAGNDLQGWIIKPPGFDPAKKYPSILEIHGGPLTQYGNFFMHEFYFLAGQGYVVHFSNPRGGRGYGEQHAGAIWGRWGTVDYDDLMAWTDYVASQPYIDPERMGVTGGSYGGYMTVWIIGHTRRFKAAVAARCVSNFVSMWGSSDLNWTFQQAVNDKAPFEDVLAHWERSPIKYIGNARTPTLVIHNEFDLRCPIEQGEQVFVALKRLGVEAEMVRFPDEFHGLSRNGRTDRRIARLKHILRWFDKYLK